ncbi:glycosyltransferase family 4 protein [Bacteroides sp. 224]|uniref:glycosyltransferase family 4 protein n=1 Tax=Bacteroides sp. 224 TaxID=2302936 RepID=UPI0013D0AAB6|nr:glycosyltransferase family 4 protein [Bacteroides sp. 224]NDV65182.1 glycosyltransferase family 4 protein [Bacteroides sp. 224]
MKIVYIYTALLTVGGADRVITEKANYFAEKCNYDVYIITDSQLNRPPVFPLSPKVTHIDLGINFGQQYKYSILKRAFVYFKLMRIYKKKVEICLKQIKPDYVFSTLGRDADFIATVKDGSKKIAEAHVAKKYIRNLHLVEQKSFLQKQIAKLWRKKLNHAVGKFDALVVLTSEDAKSWSHAKRIAIIPNSLPFYPDESSSTNNKTAISIGRLNEQKGFDRLIEAWELVYKKHPDWNIHIYGEGELKDKLETLIHEKQLGNVFFIEKAVNNITDKYLNSSIYVMSSRFEGFGMVLIEAMACGVPCVSFDCPHGPSDIIKDKEDGFLVKNGDTTELAHKICTLIEDAELRKTMGGKAKQNIKRYSVDIVMKQWVDFLNTI